MISQTAEYALRAIVFLADQGEAMLKVIDQIELTALNAAARAKGNTPAHATLPSPDSPRYREAVAEYYRRLGNR